MKPPGAILLYLAAVFLGGALLAPWVYWLSHAVAHAGVLRGLEDVPFHRFVSRCFIVVALGGLLPLLRALGLRSFSEAGLPRPDGHWRTLRSGFALGFVSLAISAVVAVLAGARGLNNTQGWDIVLHLGTAALSAVVVAVMEELVFRGAIFGGLRKTQSLLVAVLASSGLYALVHFFAKVDSPAVVEWTSGLALLPRMMRGFAAADQLVPGFLNLTLAGCALALARQRTGNLYFSIGLHAGWVFWLKSYNFFTTPTAGAAEVHWLFGTNKLIDGWLSLFVLATVLFFVSRFPEDVKPLPS